MFSVEIPSTWFKVSEINIACQPEEPLQTLARLDDRRIQIIYITKLAINKSDLLLRVCIYVIENM